MRYSGSPQWGLGFQVVYADVDKGPVCLDEAEHAVDRHGVVELVTDDRDLLDEASTMGVQLREPIRSFSTRGRRSLPSALR